MTDTPLSDDAKALFGAIFGMSKIGSDAHDLVDEIERELR